MKSIAMIIAIVSILTIGIIIPAKPIMAASMSDVQKGGIGSSNNNNNNTTTTTTNDASTLHSSGSTEQPSQSINNNSNSLVLTAVPEKPTITAGDTQTIHIKAATDNGTGISDLAIQALVMDYATGKQKVLLGGSTNEKGELDVAAAIGPHSKNSQFIVIVNTTKDDKKSSIATGFAVTEKGSGKSISTDSKGRCSGSSCR